MFGKKIPTERTFRLELPLQWPPLPVATDTATSDLSASAADAPANALRPDTLLTEEQVRPVENPFVDRLASGVVTAAPPIMLVIAAVFGWIHGLLVWQDLVIFVVCYAGIGMGITVGFHRLLTHRSFKVNRWVRAFFAALGSAAAEGPVIDWVATHRKHHQFSDEEGDPHSPHVGHDGGFKGALKGLFHAHVGWVFSDMEVADERRYAKDLLADPLLVFVDRTFVLWVIAGLALPFGLGVLLSGTITGGLEGLLWGGAARIFLMHHATFSINSLCHFFGKQDYETTDESRNLAWLAIPTWGEAWHNTHHAFPTSYRHGVDGRQIDLSAEFIELMEKLGIARDVVRIRPDHLERKAISDRAS
jgi:stearoyl-CoA desaturase (Delta-9 desaturase)